MRKGLRKAMVVLVTGGLLAATPAAAFASADAQSARGAQVTVKNDGSSKDSNGGRHDASKDRRSGEKPDASRDKRDGGDGSGDSSTR